VLIDTDSRATQAVIGQLVGVSQQAISALVNDGKIPATGTVGAVLLAYCERLRDQAAGRMGEESGGLDLVQERAALARSQRIAQDLKNDIARGEYAPIGLLTDVLATAGSAVVEELDQLEGALRKACPDLPNEAMAVIMTVHASARNKWIRSTAQLVDRSLDDLLAEQAADDDQVDGFTMDDQD
jgi:phage terminase Nu1 subunit (DNA packaging protein)